MAYVLTNGTYYIKMTKNGAVAKTDNIEEARIYLTTEKAKERIVKTPGKTKGYYIMDVGTEARYYVSNGRIRFPKEVRELIYHNADGRCALCGQKISYADMSLDHITPLAMVSVDSVENLQCTCTACNLFKGSILPDDFLERITEIFMYQMEKRCKSKFRYC